MIGEILYTVDEVSKMVGTNKNYIYALINKGLLPAMKLGSLKIRRSSLLKFLNDYDNKDLTDINNIVDLKIINGEIAHENQGSNA